MNRVRVLLADDHAMLLEAFQRLLEPDYDVVGCVTDGQSLIAAAESLQPDVFIADISMPRLNGLDAAEQLLARQPGTKLVFLTVNEDPSVAAEAIRRGALGYVLKKSASAELFEAISQAMRGIPYLTPSLANVPPSEFAAPVRRPDASRGLSPRQREVLQLLAEGKSMKEAADLLGVVPRTIAFHKYAMMEQLGLRNSAELVQFAVAHRLVSPRV